MDNERSEESLLPKPSSNWSLCALCQEDTAEKLIDPLKNTRKSFGSGYNTIAVNLLGFQNLGDVPICVPMSNLDDGSGIEETLRQNKACWHKSCFNNCSDLKLKRALKRKREADDTDSSASDVAQVSGNQSPVKTRARLGAGASISQQKSSKVCFFCDGTEGKMHRASTFDLDYKVRRAASKLQDWRLTGKLAAGDLHAMDADYHLGCLTLLYNRERSMEAIKNEKPNESENAEVSKVSLEAIAIAELSIYIEECAATGSSVFLLSDLAKLYSTRLEQLGAQDQGRINSTRLKERLLSQLPDLHAYNDGKEVRLAFSRDIGTALELAQQHNTDAAAMTLAKAATLIRKELFLNDQYFSGTFEPGCQHKAVPESLLALLSMIMQGPNIKSQNIQDAAGTDAALTLAQLLMFNSVKNPRSEKSTNIRHNISKETSLPIYLALVTHAETRKKTLVDKFYRLGLCISYDRLMQISADLGNSVCAQFEKDGLVCPPKLRKSLFTTGSVDNIDHDPSSRTAKDSFHGTAITLTQHPSINWQGFEREQVVLDPDTPKTRTIANLPESYTNINPVEAQTKKDIFAPKGHGACKPPQDLIDISMNGEYQWLNKVESLLDKEELEKTDYLSWAAHFASKETSLLKPNAITSLLPLFDENSHTVAMIQHAMKIVKESTTHLNPGQTPIIAMDQPLYALAKQIQWKKAEEYGEKKFVVMMGGLHIEMASLKIAGHWLKNSGWDSALVQANVTTSGRADAILKGAHVTRARYAHQVSACALNILQKKAYNESMSEQNEPVDYPVWIQKQCERHPQFLFWSTALGLEMLVLEFVRSIREGNFPLYVQILSKLMPWMFAFDFTNYSRWLSVHIKDLVQLKERHPSIYTRFTQGRFVVQKTQHHFSMIALDHNHEQENEMIKGDGGAVGLTESPAALRRWMVSGPEIARLVKEFESAFEDKKASTLHHEQQPSVQKTFFKDVKAVVGVIEEMGNPFSESSSDLLVLDTKEIMPEFVVQGITTAREKGQSQYDKYVEDRLNKSTVPISDTIKQNKMALFGSHEKQANKARNQVASLKSDCNLFARLYIACQSREGNLDDFFKHENSSSPPSLSFGEKLRTGQKSELVQCLETDTTVQCPVVDAKVLDASVVVNMLAPGKCKTFKEYATSVFVPYVTLQAQNVRRVDLVWDRYLPNSLKQGTREARGAGARRRVCDNGAIPLKWKEFLRSDDNKKELFHYLAEKVTSINLPGVDVFSTSDVDTISSSVVNKEGLAPCNHEEADTRILVHVLHAAVNGLKRVMIRTVDTDVVILSIAYAHKLQTEELWVAFGVGKNMRYLPIHKIVSGLPQEQCEALPFFHAFTGCDTVSYFSGRGKKTALQAWKTYPEVTTAFRSLSSPQVMVSEEQSQRLERFVVIMYSRTCSYNRVNEARQSIFSQGSRSIEAIPPTQAALEQHVRRAAYQAGHVWGRALEPMQELPTPAEWGWQNSENGWTPTWTTLPEASKVCSELIKCGCKKACRGLCKCTRAHLPCTGLCACTGSCYQD